MFHKTTEGVPQGGTISPLLLNIALNGLEQKLSTYQTTRLHQPSLNAKRQVPYRKTSPTYGYCRYADDFLITAKTREDIEAIVPILQDWLKERGLELNWEKTRIVSIQAGCNFLGFTLRQLNHKCLCIPQKEKVLAFLQRIRDWLKANPSASPETVIHSLNPILRGWGNYYQHGVSKQVFGYVDTQVWQALWRWCCKRHPQKGSHWIADKYFQTVQGRKWTFTVISFDSTGKRNLLTLKRLAKIPIQRHVKVKGTASPDDPSLKDYWRHRQTQHGKTYWETGSKYYQVAENQQWQCPVCREALMNGEALQTHHKTPLKEGGTDQVDNLVHLHQACHQQMHLRMNRSELPKA